MRVTYSNVILLGEVANSRDELVLQFVDVSDHKPFVSDRAALVCVQIYKTIFINSILAM